MSGNSSITEDLKDAGTLAVKAGAKVIQAGVKSVKAVKDLVMNLSDFDSEFDFESERDSLYELEDELTEWLEANSNSEVFNLNGCVKVAGTRKDFEALKAKISPVMKINLPPEAIERLTEQILESVKGLTGGRLSESEEQEVRTLIREYFY